MTAAVVLAGTAAGGAYVVAHGSDPLPASVASVSSASSTPSAAATSEEPEVDLDAELAAAVEPLTGDARMSVAVVDVATGAAATYASTAGETFDTASIVKVDILAALLLTAQDESRELTTAEQAYAKTMIENSDNASATKLLAAIGGESALDAANARLGLTGTLAAHAWGLTRTTADDQVRLLRAVFATEGGEDDSAPVLSAASRAYLQELMSQVEADQRWGVSAAGTDAVLKNGWMPRTTTGLWDVNSIGRVTAGGHTYLVAVLSDGHTTQAAGITRVESAAKAAVAVLSGAAAAE